MIAFNFEQKGCCGDHLVASVDIDGGMRAIIDKTNGVLIVAILGSDDASIFPPKIFESDDLASSFITENYKLR